MAEPLGHLYLIGGSDRPRVLRVLARLRERVAEEGGSDELFDAAQTAGAAVAAACDQLVLGGGRHLILVSGVEAWRAEDVAALAGFAEQPPPDTTLALVAVEALRKDHRLRGLVPEKLQLMYDAPSGRALLDHLRREASRIGADIEPEALRRLVQIVGERPFALERELDKLATYAAGEPIDAELVAALAFRGDDASPFVLTDAVSQRDRRGAFRALVRAEDTGAKPHALTPQIARQIELLRRARVHRDDGGDARSFARAEKLHEFRARKLFEAAHAWPAGDAARAIVALARADHAMKGGERIGPELALELALTRSL